MPPLLSFALTTGADGTIPLAWNAWPGGVAGSTWYFQYAIVDAGAPQGAALSNGLRALQP